MAHSKESWNTAEAYFRLSKPLSYIESKTGISKGQISKKAKKENWKKETEETAIKTDIIAFEEKKETLDKEKETLIRKVSSLESYKVTILDEVIEEELNHKSLIFNTAALSLIRKNQMLESNKKKIMVKTKHYDDNGKPSMETMKEGEIALSPNDLKIIDEGIDKNAITLEVGKRHANTSINNTLSSNTEVKTVNVTYHS